MVPYNCEDKWLLTKSGKRKKVLFTERKDAESGKAPGKKW